MPDDVDWREHVKAALAEIWNHLPKPVTTPVLLTVVSSLAEGADRIVASVLLELPGTQLEALLPLKTRLYLGDFKTADSRQEFTLLLRRASVVLRAPDHETREGAYEWAGQTMVFRSDYRILRNDFYVTGELAFQVTQPGWPVEVIRQRIPLPRHVDREVELSP